MWKRKRKMLSSLSDEEYCINSLEQHRNGTLMLTVKINIKKYNMKLDTGAGVSTISRKELDEILTHEEMIQTTVKVKIYIV